MQHEFTVAGGGLAGLIGAIALAERGGRVRVLERAAHLGGRAATQQQKGFCLNMGAHALYRNGALVQVLRRWGVPFSGHAPKVHNAAYLVDGERKFSFPTGAKSLLLTGALSLPEKLEAAGLFRKLASDKFQPAPSLTVSQWLDGEAFRPRVRKLVEMLVRLSTFSSATTILAASAAVSQVRSAIGGGVLYVDGGWETLVRALAAKAKAVGVIIETGKSLDTPKPGTILALPPEEVERVARVRLPPRRPARAACLDLGLRHLPKDAALFAMDLNQPLYLSVHSAAARLAPANSALVHVVRYLLPGEVSERSQLEAFADLLLPGWRGEAEVARFLPDMIVSHDIPGPAGRVPVHVPGLPEVALAGDWVGPRAMLSDAAAASALEAAQWVWERSAVAA